MKISTEIDSLSRLVGEKMAIEYIAKAGFDAWDFSLVRMCEWNWVTDLPYDCVHPLKGDNYLSFARELKRVGLDNGIICNQSHAPFPSEKPIMFDWLKRSIECTAEVGGEICVIHPATYNTFEENITLNALLSEKLLPFAKDHGVKIASENMWRWNAERDRADIAACATPKEFCGLLNEVNDDYLIACLDIGHAEMMGELTNAVQLIYALKDKLLALHIHDNDRKRDLHQIPFSMNIEFESIAKALKEVGYKGYLTLESNSYAKAYTTDTAFECAKKLAQSAKTLRKFFNKRL